MSKKTLNELELPTDECFGCGLANPNGLGAEFYPPEDGAEKLTGTLVVPPHGTGLPGIAHGGVLFTALDCLAGWVKFMLRPEDKLIPIGRTTTITFHKPVSPGQPVALIGTIAKDSQGPGDPMIIHGEIRDQDDNLLAEGDYTMILLPATKFMQVTGIKELPPFYRKRFLDT